MAVAVNICNDALNHLGAEYINSLEEETKIARVCKHQYPIARDYMLRTYTWNFALKRDELTPNGDTLVWGEAYEFNMPADCIRLNKVMKSPSSPARYKVEGRSILSASDVLYISYISNTTPEAYYDVAFNKAVAARLAADICFNITQSNNLQQGLYGLADQIAKDARSTDSMENTPDDYTFDYFDDSRRAGHEIYPIANEF